jgi:hypothetical protein
MSRANLTLLSSSLSGRDWLALHDPREQPHSPRWERFRQRRKERRKAGRQRWLQERHQPQLPRGVR